MRALLVSPYHGGSHAAWAEGLRRHSRHDIELLTLPDRFWKWRMHGGAVTLARRFLRDGERPDVILATDMLDLSTFLALTRRVTADVPTALYMHENQLTYPLPDDPGEGPMRRQKGERDHHYAFVNYASMQAADRVVFNSRFHRDAWFEELPRFLRHFPEFNELASVDRLRAASSVLPVGIDGAPDAGIAPAGGSDPVNDGGDDLVPGTPGDEPPLLLWNQRWEYDKNPEQMVRALRHLAQHGVPFRLALCGQSFAESPTALEEAREAFADRLVHYGFAEPDTYRGLLRDAEVTVSTAEHEFFGIAVLEAMAHGAFAVLPDRLSYPELLDDPAVSKETRRRVLYRGHDKLLDKLTWALSHRGEARRRGGELARAARRFHWSAVAPAYDELFAELVGGGDAATDSPFA
ncbi:MAG: DUF3524 domain-containing protein [Acidobacteriota bacterium]|jgi:glycosyltransferase involved in cell wall biosynthesis